MPTHELRDHTGEVRLYLQAASLPELLAEAAVALGRLQGAHRPRADGSATHEVTVRAPDRVALLVEWLNELVYLSEASAWIPERADIHHACDTEVRASVRGARLAAPPSLVKAATLHGARVDSGPAGWAAEVVLDV